MRNITRTTIRASSAAIFWVSISASSRSPGPTASRAGYASDGGPGVPLRARHRSGCRARSLVLWSADLQADNGGTRRMRAPGDILRRIYGYGDFRGQQAAIIDHVIGGGNAFVLMPTGGGKSLCYQIPALCRPGVGVV